MFDSIVSLFCALGVAWVGYTLAFIAAHFWADQWFDRHGAAHHCGECGYPYPGEECYSCGAWYPLAARDECVADAMLLGRWLGPLLAVGVMLGCVL